MAKTGIIGGTGLYEIDGLEILDERSIDTPFGAPSDTFRIGQLGGKEVVFLARHGRGHRILPTEINYKANIWGMKSLGVEQIISVSAVGSLRKDYKPQDVVIIDQFFDRTNQGRHNTFFGNGIVAHIQFSKPICADLAQILYESVRKTGAVVHFGGTYLNMEGPAFSTLAESETYRKWGLDIIGMTQLNEAKLAREAEICYATLALVTDYDCWHEKETGSTVSVEMVVENQRQNIKTAREAIKNAINLLNDQRQCSCHQALANSIMTAKELWPQETVKALGPVIEKYH